MNPTKQYACWGEFTIEPETWVFWKIGPLSLFARSSEEEWRFAWKSEGDPLDPTVEVQIPSTSEPTSEHFHSRRYTLRQPGSGLNLSPRLADLAIVIRPETPLYILPQEETTLFVSTPVWVAVSALELPTTTLFEQPVFRPSDTWFGPNTREGELCYASVTSARTALELISPLAHRAVTPIQLSNRGQDSQPIEQLRLPVAALSLYQGEDGALWTDSVVFEKSQDEGVASFHIREESLVFPGKLRLISEPRSPLHETLVESVSRLFQ